MRSFTIINIKKSSGENMSYKGGRFESNTPSSAAKKMFSQAIRKCKVQCNSMVITLRETTQDSKKKEFKYRITRKKENIEIERGDSIINFSYITTVKSLNV